MDCTLNIERDCYDTATIVISVLALLMSVLSICATLAAMYFLSEYRSSKKRKAKSEIEALNIAFLELIRAKNSYLRILRSFDKNIALIEEKKALLNTTTSEQNIPERKELLDAISKVYQQDLDINIEIKDFMFLSDINYSLMNNLYELRKKADTISISIKSFNETFLYNVSHNIKAISDIQNRNITEQCSPQAACNQYLRHQIGLANTKAIESIYIGQINWVKSELTSQKEVLIPALTMILNGLKSLSEICEEVYKDKLKGYSKKEVEASIEDIKEYLTQSEKVG